MYNFENGGCQATARKNTENLQKLKKNTQQNKK